MKVTTKFFMLALILSLMLTVSAVAAAEDISFDKSDTKNTNKNLLSTDDGKENLKTNDKTLNDETLGAQTDDNKLGDAQYTYSDLRNQIGNGKNITLNKGTYTYTSGDDNTITINNTCTIDGNGAIIDLKGKIRGLTVTASGVTIKNLSFKNAFARGHGAGIWFSQFGTVINCHFENNLAVINGAAICFANGATGIVLNCNFVNNSAKSPTGGLPDGGAIYFSARGNVTKCNFTENYARRYGGAIFFGKSDSGNMVTNCIFKDNSAGINGGAGTNGGAIASIDYNGAIFDTCIFKTNSDTTINIIKRSPTLYIDDFEAVYNSGEKLTLDLRTYSGIPVDNGIISIRVVGLDIEFTKDYNCLSGEEWDVNLPIGHYYAIFNTEYYGFQPINRTIKIMPSNSFSALSHIINSQTGNIINLTNNFKFNPTWDGDFVNGVFINRKVSINGKGYTIDADEKARIFISSYEVDLKDITFKNAITTGDGGAVYINAKASLTNCQFINNKASSGGAILLSWGKIEKCNFDSNYASGNGGAIKSVSSVDVLNSEFTNNGASYGGAIHIPYGSVKYCNYINNYAKDGGAIYSSSINVVNSLFKGNNATSGSAIYFYSEYTINVNHSTFINNRANVDDDTPFHLIQSGNTIEITFIGQNNLINAIYSVGDVDFTNVTYYGANGFTNTDIDAPLRSKNESGQKLVVEGVVGGNKVNTIKTTNKFGKIILENAAGSYYFTVSHEANLYYTQAETTFTNMYVNVTSDTTYNKTVNITATSNIPQNLIGGELLFILSNGTSFSANYVGNGIWWAVYEFADYMKYNVGASYSKLDDVVINNATITITKANSTIELDDVNIDYGESVYVYVKTEGAIAITAKVDGNDVYVSNYTILISQLDAGNHTLTVTTLPDENHISTTKTVNISVNKLNSTLTVDDMIFNYGSSGVTDISFTNASGVMACVVGHDEAVVDVVGNTIVVSNLIVGNYTLSVTTVTDGNYNNVTKMAMITVNKANSTLIINDNVTFVYNSTGFTTVTFTNASGVVACVVGYDEAVVDVVGNSIVVSNLNAGEYTLSVTTVTDGNYNNVTKMAMITVNKANSTLTINDNITFDYGSTGSTTVNFTNATGINASVIGQPNAIVNVVNNTITVSGLDAGTYTLNVTTIVDDNHNPVIQTATITVNKIKTQLTADAITTTYNVNKYLVITLKDANGNPLKGISISVDLNGVKKYTTDANGQVKVPTKGLAPKTYTAKVTFNGNTNYEKSAINVKVTVKKAASKITAGKKTFKAKTKVKKYVAVLKDSTGKAIKNAKLTLKVKGKTYAAKTNSKGKAVFKITKLNKKGTFKGVIKFNGNKYYTKSGKNVKITVKASKSKTTFKTVSKGSKDKKTVKKIQQALKDHGYYLTYKGHYLKVDGKFESCTERSVKQFQSDHGLKVTGKVDAKTAKKLGII